MNKLVICVIGILGACVLAQASSTFRDERPIVLEPAASRLPAQDAAKAHSLSVLYDFKAQTWSPVTQAHKFGQVTDLFGIKGFSPEIVALVGVTMGENRPTLATAALAAVVRGRIAGNLWGEVGLAGKLEAGRPVATGVVLGFVIKF